MSGEEDREIDVRHVERLCGVLRLHGYQASKLTLPSGLTIELSSAPPEPLSPAEKRALREAEAESGGSRALRALNISEGS